MLNRIKVNILFEKFILFYLRFFFFFLPHSLSHAVLFFFFFFFLPLFASMFIFVSYFSVFFFFRVLYNADKSFFLEVVSVVKCIRSCDCLCFQWILTWQRRESKCLQIGHLVLICALSFARDFFGLEIRFCFFRCLFILSVWYWHEQGNMTYFRRLLMKLWNQKNTNAVDHDALVMSQFMTIFDLFYFARNQTK